MGSREIYLMVWHGGGDVGIFNCVSADIALCSGRRVVKSFKLCSLILVIYFFTMEPRLRENPLRMNFLFSQGIVFKQYQTKLLLSLIIIIMAIHFLTRPPPTTQENIETCTHTHKCIETQTHTHICMSTT